MRSLRTYLERLWNIAPDQLVTVREPVDWRYEVTVHVAEMEKRDRNPALLFERVKGHSMPLLVNLFGNVDRISLALGEKSHVSGGRLEFYDEWNRLFARGVAPVHVKDGPVKEIRLRGADVDLTSLPIPRFYEQDGGRYVTAGLVAARDPGNPEEMNLSYVRMHLKGRDRFGVSLHSRGHMWQDFESSKEAGDPLDVAVIIGAHPAIYLAAAAKITDEYRKAGALLGEAVELVRCETVDVPVPAQAEVVLEGQITLEEEDEGPFTEYTGYISGRSTRNQLRVSAVTRREDAIFLAVAPSNSAEHLLLSGLPKQARISRAIADFTHTPALGDISWPVWGTHFVCLISIREPVRQTPGLAKQLGLLLLGLDHYVKMVAILPAETDLSNMPEVLGTVALRCDFREGSGLETLGEVFSQWLDPSSPRAGTSSKMIIDATGPAVQPLEPLSGAREGAATGAEGIVDFAFPCEGDPSLSVVIVESRTQDLTGLLGAATLGRSRLIVCVNADIDIRDGRQVLWAVATRLQPASDAIVRDGRMILDARKGDGWTARKASLPSSTRHAGGI
ncbi:MAG: UbiD family decarboxylase [Candidatus Bathyarchaeota archaeon]|nr:MAG: UbiD family decarboxylase [Candidatus Bathyarchaeota archaeon]